LICAEWPQGAGLWDFLREALADPVSALLVSAERSLAAEFPPQAQARAVLSAIGSGERTFSNIARAAGGIGATLTTDPVPVVAVSRSGIDCTGLDAAYGPADLLAAWPT
jgi:hypothetical protein